MFNFLEKNPIFNYLKFKKDFFANSKLDDKRYNNDLHNSFIVRILYVGLGLFGTTGGAEKAIQDLAYSLLNMDDDEIHFLTAGYPQKESKNFISMKIFTIGKQPTKFGWNFYKTSKRLETAILFLSNKYKYDLIFINTYAGYIPQIIGSRIKNCPQVVYNFHDQPSFTFFDKKGLPFSLIPSFWFYTAYQLKKRVIDSAKKNKQFFIATSKFIKNDLSKLGISEKNILLQINGVPSGLIRKKKIKQIKSIIFYTYGFNYQKGTNQLIKAFNKVQNNNWKLIITGHIPSIQYSFINKALKGLKPQTRDNIILTGAITNQQIEKMRNIVDCYISLSMSEACQLSVIEAVELHIPVLSTKVGVILDLIEKKAKNIILLSYNNLDTTINVIESFINNRKEKSSFSFERNKQIYFTDWNTVARNILDFFKEIVDRRQI